MFIKIPRKALLSLLFIIGVNILAFSQNSSVASRSALDLVKQERYQEAAKAYAGLYARFPKEPTYNYYYGFSLLKINKDLARACECLQYAHLQGGFPDAGFYLAQAWFYSYHFDKALELFNALKDTKDKFYLKDKNIAYWIEHAEYALRQTRDAVVPVCIAQDSSFRIDSFRLEKGVFATRPANLRTPNDKEADRETSFFLPDNIREGETVFFCGYGSLKLKALEIFKATYTKDNSFDGVENLGDMINSVQDEEFPYFDKRTHTLYYASKGRNSIGGYDIFMTVYDEPSKTWSTPKNMGFPINTPFDDVLYIPSSDGTKASLISNRNVMQGQWTKYEIDVTAGTKSVYVFRPEELYKMSLLTTVDAAKVVQSAPVSVVAQEEVKQEAPKDVIAEETHVTVENPIVQEDAYHQYLNAALQSQVEADSFRREAAALREKITPALSQAQKSALQRKIADLEEQAAELQRKADVNYAKVRELESMSQKTHYDQTVKSDSVPVPVVKEAVTVDAATSDAFTFEILDASPYSASNPFINKSLPQGALYRIQLGAFGTQAGYQKFGGLKPISYDVVSDGKVYKYYAGWFADYQSAVKALSIVRNNGFSDSFLVGYFDGKKLSPEKVKEMETK